MVCMYLSDFPLLEGQAIFQSQRRGRKLTALPICNRRKGERCTCRDQLRALLRRVNSSVGTFLPLAVYWLFLNV